MTLVYDTAQRNAIKRVSKWIEINRASEGEKALCFQLRECHSLNSIFTFTLTYAICLIDISMHKDLVLFFLE